MHTHTCTTYTYIVCMRWCGLPRSNNTVSQPSALTHCITHTITSFTLFNKPFISTLTLINKLPGNQAVNHRPFFSEKSEASSSTTQCCFHNINIKVYSCSYGFCMSSEQSPSFLLLNLLYLISVKPGCNSAQYELNYVSASRFKISFWFAMNCNVLECELMYHSH